MDKEWLYNYILKNCYKILEVDNSIKYWNKIYYVCKLYNVINNDSLEYALYKIIDKNDEKLTNIAVMQLLINKVNKEKTLTLCKSLKEKYNSYGWDYSTILFHLEHNNAFENEECYNVGFQYDDLKSISSILNKSYVSNYNEVYSRYPLEFQKILCQLIFYEDVMKEGVNYFYRKRTKKIVDDFFRYNNHVDEHLVNFLLNVSNYNSDINDIIIKYFIYNKVEAALLEDIRVFFQKIQNKQ